MRRVTVTVSGRVQGVGFRWSTRGEATRRGLAGWVRNRDDGTVEAELEGADDDVEDMVTWLHHGPGSAEVAGVVVAEITPTGETGFRQR
ncbi:acylphosphatase [Serinibacter arcticus]|uniref:Acylphosphatase n=1 Tax=Serinibacter arcticus TaxID=1655435 RepID=A0A2U1ZVR5_9MICO|nr:acylphosphatase [Serinibacter arcticus]PWD51061.1 acylphosphatase [Serinibacter arcticus]